MKRRLRIALLIESSRSYGRDLLRGIADYSRTYDPWTFYFHERSIDDPVVPQLLQGWKADGLIVRIVNAKFGNQVRQLGMPTVDLMHEIVFPDIPRLIPNQEAIVKMAVDHLAERCFRNFAFVGFRNLQFSEERRRLFLNYVESRGFAFHVFEDSGSLKFTHISKMEAKTMVKAERLAAWLQNLPKPTGIVACNDMRAYQVLNVCGECGVSVPGELAVVGVDNDPVLCELADPPLTSVDPNVHRIGFEAAAMVHRMIQGIKPPAITFIEPSGVQTRRSTDILAIDDEEFARVFRFIRSAACQGLSVGQIVKEMAISRSTLERLFAKHLGHSPREEIVQVQLARVKELLMTSNLTVEKIARMAGFSNRETLYRLFKKKAGMSPNEFREPQGRPAAGFDTNRLEKESHKLLHS